MRRLFIAASALSAITLAASTLALPALACPYGSAGGASWRVADSTPATTGTQKTTNTTAYPDSPNNSPAAGENGKPVVTDHAACGTVKTAACAGSPAPSGQADTSDTSRSSTTVNAPKN